MSSERPFPPSIRSDIRPGVKVINEDSYLSRNARYLRSPEMVEILPGENLRFRFDVQPMGTRRTTFEGTEYQAIIDGVPAMIISVTDGEYLQYDGPLPFELDHGWHYLWFEPQGREVCIPLPFFVHTEEGGPVDWLPIMTNSQRVVMHGDPFVLQVVPNKFEPVARPLTPRDCPPFDYVPEGRDLFLTQIAHHQQMPRYPVKTDNGATAVNTGMAYFSGIVTGPQPRLPLYDGPAGVGNIGPAMFIMEGEADCEGHPTLYVLESHRLIRVKPDGEITTLVGKRSKKGELPSEFHSNPVYENVGDWSGVPEDRHDFAEGWAVAVDPSTVGVDRSQPRIASEGNQHPHFADADGFGPVMYITDSLHERILRIEFSATVRQVPDGPLDSVRVTEWTVPGEIDAWGLDAHPDRDGKMIAADRKNHRVVVLQHNPETKQADIVDTLLQGESTAYVTKAPGRRLVKGSQSTVVMRRQPIVLPEMVRVIGRNAYVSSGIQGRIQVVNCDTKENETYIDNISVGRGYTYLQFDISDGSCFPAGYVAVADWSTDGPRMFNPDGVSFDAFKRGGGGSPEMGRGGFYTDPGYIASVSFGRAGSGAMYWNTVYGGLRRLSLATEDDPFIDYRLFKDGSEHWTAKGYQDRFGPTGHHDWFGEELPWGESEEIDYYLQACGHTPPDSNLET